MQALLEEDPTGLHFRVQQPVAWEAHPDEGLALDVQPLQLPDPAAEPAVRGDFADTAHAYLQDQPQVSLAGW